jgi:hypothetical protein
MAKRAALVFVVLLPLMVAVVSCGSPNVCTSHANSANLADIAHLAGGTGPTATPSDTPSPCSPTPNPTQLALATQTSLASSPTPTRPAALAKGPTPLPGVQDARHITVQSYPAGFLPTGVTNIVGAGNKLLYYSSLGNGPGSGGTASINSQGNVTLLKTFTRDPSQPVLTHLAAATGRISASNAFMTVKVYGPDCFSNGWALVAGIQLSPGTFLVFARADGSAALGRLDDAGAYTNLQNYPACSFASWTHFQGVGAFFLAYNADTGGGAIGTVVANSSFKFGILRTYPNHSFSCCADTGKWSIITATDSFLLYYNAAGGAAVGKIVLT